MRDKKKIEKKLKEAKGNLSDLVKKSNLKGPGTSLQSSSANENALKLCDAVLAYVPEFKDYKEFTVWADNGKENPYMHFGSFGRFLVEQIEKSPDSDVVKKSFNFINDSYNVADGEYVRTMLGTEVFENFTTSEKTKTIASESLKGDASADFKKTLAG